LVTTIWTLPHVLPSLFVLLLLPPLLPPPPRIPQRTVLLRRGRDQPRKAPHRTRHADRIHIIRTASNEHCQPWQAA
jgi:hypothetical protein